MNPESHTERITVVGRARRTVEADVANLVVWVVEVDADQRAAFARCAERIDALLPRLRDAAPAARVTTGNLEVDRHYDEDDDAERTRRYAASCRVGVECAPEAAAPAVAEAVTVGIDRLQGPRYGVRDPAAPGDELLGEAYADARRKAERLADAAGRPLGAAVAVEEGDHRFHDGFESEWIEAAGTRVDLELEPAGIVLGATVRVSFALNTTAAPH